MSTGRSAVSALAIAMLLVWSTVAFAAKTELEKFERKVGRFASSDSFLNPKGLCVCQDGSSQHGFVGALKQLRSSSTGFISVVAICRVREFLNGSFIAENECLTYVPLAK